MPSFYDLDLESFAALVPRAPTLSELQAALDKQDFVSRFIVSPVEPVEVESGTPPLYEWRGRLDGKDVAFRIGVTQPAKLPGFVDTSGFPAWPVAIWCTNSGEPAIVGAGWMAVYAWASATGGAIASGYPREVALPPKDTFGIDLVLSRASGDWDKLRARYGDIGPDTSPEAGQPLEIRIRVHR